VELADLLRWFKDINSKRSQRRHSRKHRKKKLNPRKMKPLVTSKISR